MRFVQALVRDTIATGLSRLRRTRVHARLADALERLQPGGISPLAYHYSRAATAATAAKAARYCVQAAEYAEASSSASRRPLAPCRATSCSSRRASSILLSSSFSEMARSRSTATARRS